MNPTINSNFNGDVAEELMMLAVTQNEIVDGGHINIEDDIQLKRSIPRVRQSNIIQNKATTPISYGGVSTDERVLDPDEFMVYVEFDPNEFRKMWSKWAPNGVFVFTELAPEVQADLLKMLLEGEAGVNNYMGSAIINGDKAAGVDPLDKFNGLIVKALADTDVIDVATPVALTSVNIQAKMQAVYDASRIPVRDGKNYKMFLSTIDFEKYRQSLVDNAYKSIDVTQDAPNKFHGREIVKLVDIPENTMFATRADNSRASNIWMGVRGLIDFSTIQVDKLQANSDLWFFKMKMSADTQIKFGQDFVLYHP